MKGLIVCVVIFVLLLVCIMGFVKMYASIYNSIIEATQQVNKGVGDLESEYQRRYALIDNLLEIVKKTEEFEKYLVGVEKDIYIKVAEAKATATKLDMGKPAEFKNRVKKESGLGSMLTNFFDKLMVMAQKYPEIKDPKVKDRNKTFESLEKLRSELKDIEENILHTRKCLNEYTRVYNQTIQIFPANIIANRHNFKDLTFFEVLNEEAREDVKISF